MSDEEYNSSVDDGWKMEEAVEPDAYRRWRAELIDKLDSNLGISRRMGDWLMAVPDLSYLAVRFLMDPEVETDLKLRFLAGIGYVVAPWNILPRRMLGPIGILDDFAALALSLDTLVNGPDPWIVHRHWSGGEEPLRKIQEALSVSRSLLPSVRQVAWLLRGRRR